MPTRNRAAYIGLAIESFLSQTYAHKELVIIDNGDDGTEKLIPDNPQIRYQKLPGAKRRTGEMRNLCCNEARGEVIVHFDSDDWSAPGRIADQVQRLTESGKQITGYGRINFYDERDGKAYLFIPELKEYMFGTSLCYYKSWWSKNWFDNRLDIGEDWEFAKRDLSQAIRGDGTEQIVARIHPHQTSVKAINRSEYNPIPVEQLPSGFLSAIQCHQ